MYFDNFWHTDIVVNFQQNCPPLLMVVLTLLCEKKQVDLFITEVTYMSVKVVTVTEKHIIANV